MNIDCIFAGKLYAFRYNGESLDEFSRLINLWNDNFYVFNFLKQNKADIPENKSIYELADQIRLDAKAIDILLHKLGTQINENLDFFFKPLYNHEYHLKTLSLRKGRGNYLRLYAIKIDKNLYVITGGTIKLTQFMKDRPHTNYELIKIHKCHDYLNKYGIFDADSFYEWKIDFL